MALSSFEACTEGVSQNGVWSFSLAFKHILKWTAVRPLCPRTAGGSPCDSGALSLFALLPQFPPVGRVLLGVLGVLVDITEEQKGFQTPEMHHSRHARLFFSVCWDKPRALCVPTNARPLSSVQPQVMFYTLAPDPREMAKFHQESPGSFKILNCI